MPATAAPLVPESSSSFDVRAAVAFFERSVVELDSTVVDDAGSLELVVDAAGSLELVVDAGRAVGRAGFPHEKSQHAGFCPNL